MSTDEHNDYGCGMPDPGMIASANGMRARDSWEMERSARQVASPATKKLIAPCIHSNGTSEVELLEQYDEAYMAIGSALDALKKSAPNGRDYYVYGSEALGQAIEQHRQRMLALTNVQFELQALCEAIGDGTHRKAEIQYEPQA